MQHIFTLSIISISSFPLEEEELLFLTKNPGNRSASRTNLNKRDDKNNHYLITDKFVQKLSVKYYKLIIHIFKAIFQTKNFHNNSFK